MSDTIMMALWIAAFVVVSGLVAYVVDRRDRRRGRSGRYDDLKRRMDRMEADIKGIKENVHE